MKETSQSEDVSMSSSNDSVSQAVYKILDLENGSGIAVHDDICRTSTGNECLNCDDGPVGLQMFANLTASSRWESLFVRERNI